jgi:hypothetical protein
MEEIEEVLQAIAMHYDGFVAERKVVSFTSSQLDECA